MSRQEDQALNGFSESEDELIAEAKTSALEERATRAHQLHNHPLRYILNNELHAQPFIALRPPGRVSHRAIHSGEQRAVEDHVSLVKLCERYGVTSPIVLVLVWLGLRRLRKRLLRRRSSAKL